MADEIEDPQATMGTARRRVVMSGSNMGKTCGQSVQWPVAICDACGCAHRARHRHHCNSCFDAIRSVEMEQAMDRFRTAANTLARAFRDAGNALGDYEWCGLSPMQLSLSTLRDMKRFMIHPTEPDARRFAIAHLDPHFDDSVADPIVSSALLTPTPFSEGNDFQNILRGYGRECPQPAEPVMKRNKRNRGPGQHGKWWLNWSLR